MEIQFDKSKRLKEILLLTIQKYFLAIYVWYRTVVYTCTCECTMVFTKTQVW